jgi:HEAT repeat protein
MRRLLTLGWKARWLVLILVVGIGVAGWVQRGSILTRYYLERLARCAEGDEDAWVGRIATLDNAATPGLLAALRKDDAKVTSRVERCLGRLMQRWGPSDPRTVGVVVQSAKDFSSYSVHGRDAALRAAAAGIEPLKETAPSQLAVALLALIRQATRDADESVHAAALTLADASPIGLSAEYSQACVELARIGLKEGNSENRALAVRVAARPASGLNVAVVAALRDPSADVRREALLAVGPWDDAIATEDLLQWLHDPEAPVRRACEQMLRVHRHLAESHIEMGRALTDARPAVRLHVLDFLNGNSDVDPSVWLRRLSHDPSPAVRAATIRAATELSLADLADRLDQMAQDDPSPTVRQLARYYLVQHTN